MGYARVFAGVLGVGTFLLAGAATAATWPDDCRQGTLANAAGPNDQQILTCVPDNFKGSLIVYAHGYVRPQEPLALPNELGDADLGKVIEELLDLGFGFATSSYSKNGYAVKQAGDDLNQLVEHIKSLEPGVDKVYITGASEGGLIATMLLEKHPQTYKGGLALCAPLAGSSYQIAYSADVRVLFDHFYPTVFGDAEIFPFNVPDDHAGRWTGSSGFRSRIAAAIRQAPGRASQLFDVAGVVCRPNRAANCAQDILRYSVAGTNDLLATAGGWPVSNIGRTYKGSNDDAALNAGVQRYKSKGAARTFTRRYYRPSGRLKRDLVTLHTTGDWLVPYEHEHIYLKRARRAGKGNKLTVLPVDRAGHCKFKVQEVVGALASLLLKTDPELALELALDLANPLDALRRIIDLDAGTGKIAELVQDRANKLVDQIDDGLDVLGDAKDSAQDQAKKTVKVANNVTDKAKDVFDDPF